MTNEYLFIYILQNYNHYCTSKFIHFKVIYTSIHSKILGIAFLNLSEYN